MNNAHIHISSSYVICNVCERWEGRGGCGVQRRHSSQDIPMISQISFWKSQTQILQSVWLFFLSPDVKFLICRLKVGGVRLPGLVEYWMRVIDIVEATPLRIWMLGQPVVRPATLSRCHPALHIRNPDEMVTHNVMAEIQNRKIHDKFDDLLRVHREGSGQEDGLNEDNWVYLVTEDDCVTMIMTTLRRGDDVTLHKCNTWHSLLSKIYNVCNRYLSQET